MEQNRIAVDTDALRSAADKADSSINTLSENIGKFRSVIESLNSSWSSDVKNKFFTSYENDIKALNEMLAQYSEVSASLRQIADEQQKNEEDVRSEIDKARRAQG